MEIITTENLDSTNEEIEDTDSTNSEEDSTGETTEGTSEESKDEKKDEYSDREKQLYARAKKAEKELKEFKEKTPDASADEVTLSRLEVRGVMEKEDQDYVLRFAKAEGISPIDALSDDIVQDRLKSNERKRTSEKATPRSNNRAATKEDEVAMWVRKYEKTGELPEDNPALTSKILDKLAGA